MLPILMENMFVLMRKSNNAYWNIISPSKMGGAIFGS